MLIKQKISNNPLVSTLDRWVEAEIIIGEHVQLIGRTFYVDKNEEELDFVKGITFNFTTQGNFVDQTGALVDPDENGEYPTGSIPESIFLKNLPKSMIPDPTIYGCIKALASLRIKSLDDNQKF